MCHLCKSAVTPDTSAAPRSRSHEQYVSDVVRAVLHRLPAAARRSFPPCRVTYGAGPSGARGVTYYGAWRASPRAKTSQAIPLIAICATGQSSLLQLCGTIVHELGHVLAGLSAGHGPEWHAACQTLGLGGPGLAPLRAAGTDYTWEHFAPDLRATLQAIPAPRDGAPAPLISPSGAPLAKPRPCGAAWGSRGGKSRGTGSGSRLLKWICSCERPQVVRHAGRDLAAICPRCSSAFTLVEDSLPQAHTNGLGAARAAQAWKAAQAPLTATPPPAPAQPPKEAPPLPPEFSAVPF